MTEVRAERPETAISSLSVGAPRVGVASNADQFLVLKAVHEASGAIVDFECVGASEQPSSDDQLTRSALIGARLRNVLPGRAGVDLLEALICCMTTEETLELDSFVYRDEAGLPLRLVAIYCAKDGEFLRYSWRETVDQSTLAKHYELLAKHTSDVTALLDPDGRYSWTSPTTETTFGRTREELLGVAEVDLVSSVDAASFLEELGVDISMSSRSIEYRYRCADDEIRWMSRRSTQVLDDSGIAVAALVVLRDIHDEVLSRQARAASERRYRALTDEVENLFYRAETDGTITWISPSITKLLGLEPTELLGTNVASLYPLEDASAYEEHLAQLWSGEVVDAKVRVRVAADGERLARVRVFPVFDDEGLFIAQISALQEIEVTESPELVVNVKGDYQGHTEAETGVVFRTGTDTTVEWVSPSITTLAGWTIEEVVGHRIAEFVVPDDWPHTSAAVPEVIGRSSASFQGRLLSADGDFRWVSIQTDLLFGEKGETIGAAVKVRDVHVDVLAREALSESEQRFRLAMESAPIGMAVIDLDQRFLEVNPALCEMLGRNEKWLTSHLVPDILGADDDGLELFVRAATLSGRVVTPSIEKLLFRPDGTALWVEVSVGTVRDQSGLPVSYVSTFVDVTETKATREELTYLATHDVLTRLVNRRDLYDRVDDVMSHTRRSGTRLGALFIDVDNLKHVNDSFGHSVGDQVLVALAERLTSAGRSDDIVSRIGGDEFVILLPWLHSIDDAELVALRVLSSLEQPIQSDVADIQVSVSIGVAFAAPGESADEILRHADAALYRAKTSGRAQSVTYDAKLDRSVMTHRPQIAD